MQHKTRDGANAEVQQQHACMLDHARWMQSCICGTPVTCEPAAGKVCRTGGLQKIYVASDTVSFLGISSAQLSAESDARLVSITRRVLRACAVQPHWAQTVVPQFDTVDDHQP